MSRGGIGSASIVLIFAVLCLAIFAVISLVPALNEQTLIETEVRLVQSFHAADALAEQILAEILELNEVPEEVRGIEISAYWDWDLLAEVISFICPISDTKGLLVTISRDFDSYEILTWRMINMAEWEADDRLNVWQGDFDFDEDFLTGW
ncbi:MAG: hypothetical protein FWC89_03515 [Defluviitaleaceae bacterium]|nr:hypothetical protein [Defluviitaleaceae bacterium]